MNCAPALSVNGLKMKQWIIVAALAYPTICSAAPRHLDADIMPTLSFEWRFGQSSPDLIFKFGQSSASLLGQRNPAWQPRSGAPYSLSCVPDDPGGSCNGVALFGVLVYGLGAYAIYKAFD